MKENPFIKITSKVMMRPNLEALVSQYGLIPLSNTLLSSSKFTE